MIAYKKQNEERQNQEGNIFNDRPSIRSRVCRKRRAMKYYFPIL